MTQNDRNLFPGEPPEVAAHSTVPAAPAQTAADSPAEGALAAEQVPEPAGRPVPEDLRVPWDWLDLLLFLAFAAGATIVFGAILALGLSLFHETSAQMQKSQGLMSLLNVGAQVVLDLCLLGFLVVQMRVRFRSPFWRTIGWRPLQTQAASRSMAYLNLVLGGLLLGMVTSVAEAAFPPKHPLPVQTFLQDPRTALLFMLTAVAIAPLVEETLFRGYLYPVIARSFGVGAGVVATGVLFGLLHSIQLWGGWWQIALLVFVGIAFTLARALMRTVLASYILHLTYNSLQVLALLVGTHGLRQMPLR